MRGAAAALVLASASAAALAADLPATPFKSSANGVYAIRLQQLDEKRCRVEVVKDQELVWQLEKCLATVDDLLFVNNKGTHFWVLHVLPEIPEPVKGGRGKGPRPDPIFDAVVATQHDHEGHLLATRRLRDVLELKRRGLVRKLEKRFKWLEGVLGVPGKPPRLSDEEVLEFEVVGGRMVQLRF